MSQLLHSTPVGLPFMCSGQAPIVVPGRGSLFGPGGGPNPGRFKGRTGDWAKLVGVVTGETLDLPPLLLSLGDFRMAKVSREFLNIAAEVRFSRSDPELAIAFAKNGGRLGMFGPGPPNPGGKGSLGPPADEGPEN